MVCPSCLIALAGFGDESATQNPTQTLPTEVGTEVLGSLAYVVGGPVVGSLVFTIVGAVAWKSHRVAGGAIGLVGGGILGGLIGSYLAKRKIEAVLPQLQQALDQAADASVPVTPDGSFVPPAGGWTIGPLELPAGTVKAPNLLPGNVSVAPLQLLGLLALSKPPPANSAGPLKMSIPVKQPLTAAASAWQVPTIKNTSPIVGASSGGPPLIPTKASGAPPLIPTKSSGGPPTIPIASVPYDREACRSKCSETFGQQMLTGDSSGWYKCWAACDVPPPASGQAPLNIDAPAYVKPGSVPVPLATSMFAKLGAAVQAAIAPKTVIPSSSAVTLVMPGVKAPTTAQPVVKPALQVVSSGRQVVLPTATVNTATYGSKPALTM